MKIETFKQIGLSKVEVELSELVLIPSELISNGKSLQEADVVTKPFSTTNENDHSAAYLSESGEYTPVYIDVDTIKQLHKEKEQVIQSMPFFASQTGEHGWYFRQGFEEFLDLDFSVIINPTNKFNDFTTFDISVTYNCENNSLYCFVGVNYGEGMEDEIVDLVFHKNVGEVNFVTNLDECKFNAGVTREEFEKFVHTNSDFNRVIKGLFGLIV